jgi:hypothetical protein
LSSHALDHRSEWHHRRTIVDLLVDAGAQVRAIRVARWTRRDQVSPGRWHIGWHRHMLLMMVAHLFLLEVRKQFQKKR